MDTTEDTTSSQRKIKRDAEATSVNLPQHAVPTGSAGKVDQSILDAAKSAEQTAVIIILSRRLNGPVNHHGAAHDGVTIHKTPVAAIPAPVAVISHHEEMIGRHQQLAVADRVHDLIRPFGA